MLYEEIKKFILKFNMITKGQTVLAAVSGGADSVCMLRILDDLSKEVGFSLYVMNIEHGIRGDESIKDSGFVKELCEKLDISCKIQSVDALLYAKENKQSVEEAARFLRYEALRQYAHKIGAQSIALAHNLNDQAETLLFNLLRGSDVSGLSAMKPQSNGLIRPLINTERTLIEEYLKDIKQDYRTDSTNADTIYSRNLLRHEVMPLLERVNKRAVKHIARMANSAAMTEEYLRKQTADALKECCMDVEGGICINVKKIQEFDLLIRRRIIYEQIVKMAEKKKDITQTHVENVMALLKSSGNKKVNLPYDLVALKSYDKLYIKRHSDKKEEVINKTIDVSSDSFFMINSKDKLSWRVFPFDADIGKIPKCKYTKWFDYDKIRDKIVLRNYEKDDYICISTDGHTQSIKKYFINNKVRADIRKHIAMLCSGSEVIWICGYRDSAAFRVDADTKMILEFKYERDNT